MSVEGNQNAYKNKPWADALRRAMLRYDGGKESALNLIAEQTVKLAVSGEQWAIKEIGDRSDGKAHQSIEQKTEHSGEISHNISKVPELTKEEWMIAHGLGTTAGTTE